MHKQHDKRIPAPAGLKPAITKREDSRIHALDRAITEVEKLNEFLYLEV